MPFMESSQLAGKKRKRPSSAKLQKRSSREHHSSPDPESDVRQLQNEVLQSRKNYNNIVKLHHIAFPDSGNSRESLTAVVALCRVFCHLLADGAFDNSPNLTPAEKAVLPWLEDRYKQYTTSLLPLASEKVEVCQDAAVPVVMRLVRREVEALGEHMWAQGLFAKVLRELLAHGQRVETSRVIFIEQFFTQYDDVRFFTLQLLPTIVEELREYTIDDTTLADAILQILSTLQEAPQFDADLKEFLASTSRNSRISAASAKGHKRKAQDSWLALLKLRLAKSQRKQILSMLLYQVVPWFTRAERLMDFLTDSYNQGGETTLLALAGLFDLMQEKNLDYPLFYQKLYSLLDGGILLSKHRSRFFRLLDTFMGSTHLPAALVASFIKRLSRLALSAPPPGIVAVIPWIYNMFKMHPACTFMMHRVSRCKEETIEWETYGAEDPFNMEEENPMETGAIDSCVWELVCLQSHYHPNVATLAKIISEQFTKQSYNLEDFLDHSYNSLLDVELGRELKKIPVVEYQIPKTIMQAEEGSGPSLWNLYENVLDESK